MIYIKNCLVNINKMRILIANRALSALKFVTSIKEWLRKETETKLTLIGLVTEEDMDSDKNILNY